jgi:hypothetical protein
VHISPEVRRSAAEESGDPEEMIKGCVWRFIWLKQKTNEVKGDVVNFTIRERDFVELLSDLRRIKQSKETICRSSNKLRAKG